MFALVEVVELVSSFHLGDDFPNKLDVPGTAGVFGGFDQVYALVPGAF